MNFLTAIQTCYEKIFDYEGRASRSEYWWFALFHVIASVVIIVLLLITDASYADGLFAYLVMFLTLGLPSISVSCRRLHDSGESGWWQLLWMAPFTGEEIGDFVDDYILNDSFSDYLISVLGPLYWIIAFAIVVCWIYYMCRKGHSGSNKYGDPTLKTSSGQN